MTHRELAAIQATLSEAVEAPVGLRVRIPPGRYTELEADATAAPPPGPATDQVLVEQPTSEHTLESTPEPQIGHVVLMRRQEQ